MSEVFLKVLNISLIASLIVAAAVVFRLVFRKAPKWTRCVMWAIVALRLLMPFSIESPASVVPVSEPVPREVFDHAVTVVPPEEQFVPPETVVPAPSVSAPAAEPEPEPETGFTARDALNTASVVWLAGVGAMLAYLLAGYVRVRLRVREAVKLDGNVYLCDGIGTPFILGLAVPRIYIPSELGSRDAEIVLAHEKAHLSRRDH